VASISSSLSVPPGGLQRSAPTIRCNLLMKLPSMNPHPDRLASKSTLKLAIVGGGRTCKFFLDLIRNKTFPLLDIQLVGVCDTDPNAEGYVMARQMGIYTTDNFREFFKIRDLDGIIELTNNENVFLELIKSRPKEVGVLEHKIGKLLRNLFSMNQRLKTAEQEMLLEKMSSDFLIQQSNAAIVVLNTDFTIVEANEAYLNIVNKTKAEVIGRTCYETYYGLKSPCSIAKPELPCPMLETLETGKSAHVIHEIPAIKNRPIYGNIVTYPLKNKDGEILRIIEIWRDITEAITDRWEKRVAELKANLNKMVQEDRMISLGKLVASCVHEINNPLQGLLTFSHIMQDMLNQQNPPAADLEKIRHFTELMATELERCGNIVSGLLSFARETPLEYKEIDFKEVIEAVISLTRHKMELQNIKLASSLPAGMVPVRGDTYRLQQCVLNLIFNAIEAMPDGGELNIDLQLEPDGRGCWLKVADTGTGIPAEDLDHLFDPFFTTKPEGQGTGLGLSIVYGVVKNHNGSISVKSSVGKGTVFTLTLPISKSH
jgi:signal transduction histidine kinase